MHIHEYQAKKLFQAYGIPTLAGREAYNLSDVRRIMNEFGDGPVVVKAQVHAGGRGKAGGILPARNAQEAVAAAESLLGKVLHTKQTGPEGKTVRRLYIERQARIQKEYYVSLLIDPANGKPVLIASGEGGMEIETLSERRSEKVFTQTIAPATGYQPYHGYAAANAIGLAPAQKPAFIRLLDGLYRLFWEKDCSMIEINPLARTEQGGLIALDAKVSLDESAFFRHPELADLRDREEEPPLEALAADNGMNYVALDGDIGCLVIGAGLGMSTMDAVRHFGGRPANFMDCGGSVTAEKAKKAFLIVAAGNGVKGVLVNIFGGITRTDLIAEGIADALRERGKPLPLVVRLEGNGSETGKALLQSCGFPVVLAESLTEATRKILALTAEQGDAL